MSWQGHLHLRYTRDHRGTVAHDRHDGPLRVLQRLYPEGPAVCHHVLVHPPGGIVGGDTLEVHAHLGPRAHALLTTPGATRYYRSAGKPAVQLIELQAQTGARLEWLPLETIAYNGAVGVNRVVFALDDGAEMIGWDVLALGLPAAGVHFERGSFEQHLQWPGVWLERGHIDATDRRLLDSPLGFAGHRALATLWFASGSALAGERKAALLDVARDAAAASTLDATCGTTAPDNRVIVVRILAARVEPAMRLARAIRAAWRGVAWDLPEAAPRVWHT